MPIATPVLTFTNRRCSEPVGKDLSCSPFTVVRLLGVRAFGRLGACDLDERDSETPWIAYAWNREAKTFMWLCYNSESHRDCMDRLETFLKNFITNYSKPYGCAFHTVAKLSTDPCLSQHRKCHD